VIGVTPIEFTPPAITGGAVPLKVAQMRAGST
jgi:hypothetical protein